MCIKPYQGQAVLNKGDLVKMGPDSTGDTLQKTMWCYGQFMLHACEGFIMVTSLFPGKNEKTKKEGDFPLDSLYILPTLSKPSNDILVKNNLKIHFDNTPTSYVFVFFQDAFYQV